MRVAAPTLDEADMDDVVAFGIRPVHLPEKLGVDRMTLFLEHVQREGDVRRRHLRAVEKTRFGSQPETVVELVGRDPDRLREQAVDRIRLIAVGGHQRVEGGRHAGRAIAFPGVDVEGVESVEVLVAARSGNLQRQQATRRRLGIHVGEMREVGRQREISKRRQAVNLHGIVGKRGERAADERRQHPARAGLKSRSAGQCHGHRIVRLLSASIYARMYRALPKALR